MLTEHQVRTMFAAEDSAKATRIERDIARRTRLEDLADLDLYLGTPYSKYPKGIEQAFIDACRLCGELLRRGLKVYSPIAHTHPIAIHAGIDPLDLSVWLPFDEVRMAKADAMLVAQMAGWDASSGVAHEIDVFTKAAKPVYFLDPNSFALTGGK